LTAIILLFAGTFTLGAFLSFFSFDWAGSLVTLTFLLVFFFGTSTEEVFPIESSATGLEYVMLLEFSFSE